jgi:ribosomal-protein-alanine N-acetyltransferase
MRATDRSVNVVIRPYQPTDCGAIIAMLAESEPWKALGYTAAHWEHIFTPMLQGREGYVIEQDETAAGIGLLRRWFLFGDYLELFAVAPAARGRGLGTTLLAYLEKLVFARGKNLFVCVSDFNHTARRFYQRHGYHEVGAMHNLLIAGSAEILLRKTIGPASST